MNGRRETPGQQLVDRGDIARAYEENQAWPPEVAEAVARHFLSSIQEAPRRCLFLGTATGVNDARPFARIAGAGDRILAGDLEPAFVDRLRARAKEEGLGNLDGRILDVTQDLSALGEFDLVTLLFVIHRLKDWKPTLDRLVRLVAPGGSFFISEFAGPGGIIYLSNEGGGRAADPVSRMIRRYFELLPERFAPALKSTDITPVLSRLAEVLTPLGHREFEWEQSVTPAEMHSRIEERAYAPFFSTRPSALLLEQLRNEFASEWTERVRQTEIVRIRRFGRLQ